MRTYLLVAVGGALGSIARYAMSGWVNRLTTPSFHYGTFAVNIVGCLVFGLIAGAASERFAVGPSARAFLLVGILGGFTTFSSFGFETFQLLRDGQVGLACLNIGGQVVCGLAAMWAGYSLHRLL